MKNLRLGLIIIATAGLIGYAAYFIMYPAKNMHHKNVEIQTIQDEVDQDAQSCTDGMDDCKKNTEFFTETWLYTGKNNFDPVVNFSENIWEEKE